MFQQSNRWCVHSAGRAGISVRRFQLGRWRRRVSRATTISCVCAGPVDRHNREVRSMTARVIRRAFVAATFALPLLGIGGFAHAGGGRFVFVSPAPGSASWGKNTNNAPENDERDLGRHARTLD